MADGFIVIDNNTGKYPDVEEIVLREKWASGLIHCDVDGFAITESGTLLLVDECGCYAVCPDERFTVAKVEAGIYDQEETFPDCTVQVLTNTATGDTSVGWWRNA